MVAITTSHTFYGRQGGKSRMANRLIPMFPRAHTFVEPFMGAGNILLRIKKGEYAREVANDKDTRMYQLMYDIQRVTPDEVRNLYLVPERAMFESAKLNVRPPDGVMTPYRLNLNLYTVWCSFRGMCRSYGAAGLTKPVSRLARLAKRLPRLQDRLRGVDVRNQDCYELIAEFAPDADAFIYCDPPYYESDTSGYTHKTVCPYELARALSRCDGRWMVTYNDHPVVRHAFRDYLIQTMPTIYCGRNGIKSTAETELVITNYVASA